MKFCIILNTLRLIFYFKKVINFNQGVVPPTRVQPLAFPPEFVYRITRKLMFALPTITTTVENYCELRVMDFNGCWWWAKAPWMGDLVMKIEVMALRLTLIQFKLVSHLKMIWEILHLWILGIFRIFMVSNHHKNHFWYLN